MQKINEVFTSETQMLHSIRKYPTTGGHDDWLELSITKNKLI